MIYLAVKEVKFEEIAQDDELLMVGRFSREQLEEMLKKSENDVFSVYFYQRKEDVPNRTVRLGFGEYTGATTRGDDGLPCPRYCNP